MDKITINGIVKIINNKWVLRSNTEVYESDVLVAIDELLLSCGEQHTEEGDILELSILVSNK